MTFSMLMKSIEFLWKTSNCDLKMTLTTSNYDVKMMTLMTSNCDVKMTLMTSNYDVQKVTLLMTFPAMTSTYSDSDVFDGVVSVVGISWRRVNCARVEVCRDGATWSEFTSKSNNNGS